MVQVIDNLHIKKEKFKVKKSSVFVLSMYKFGLRLLILHSQISNRFLQEKMSQLEKKCQ